jgi:hypothetical protein
MKKNTQFIFDGMCIHNPMISECGRFEVSPETYGFDAVNTSGGCMAWRRSLEDGGYLLLTDNDGIHPPEHWTEAIIGRYDAEGNTVVEPHPLTFEAPGINVPEIKRKFAPKM